MTIVQKIVIDIFMYIFEALLLWYYANSLFEGKKNKTICLLDSIVVNAILMAVYQLQIVYLNGILLLVLYFLFFVSFYYAGIKSALFHALIFIIVMFATEVLVMGIGTVFFKDFNAMDNDMTAYLYVVSLSKLLHIIIILIISKLFAYQRNKEQYNKYYWFLFLLPISSILMVLAFRYLAYDVMLTPFVSTIWVIASVLTVFSNVLVFIIYEYSNKNTRELYELKTIARQEEQDKRYYDIIEQSNKDMRVLVHDIKNHLSYVQGLDSVKEIHNYIDSLSNDIDKSYYAGISKNKTLDLIIGKYFKLCEANNIKFSVDVKTSNLNYIDSIDLSTLLNNLLDNAFDAAKGPKDAFIEFVVFSKNDSYDGLMIRNSCLNAPKTKDGQLVTTKRDKTMHGLGLTSIHKVLKKYNAMLDWEYNEANHIFETHIVFNKE